jgi:hypothetical protein
MAKSYVRAWGFGTAMSLSLILSTLSTLPTTAQEPAAPPPPVFTKVRSETADLNGDRKPETIDILADREKPPKYYVAINGVRMTDGFYSDEDLPGLNIVKMDSAAKKQQLAVLVPGPSDQGDTQFYQWDGKALQKLGSVPNVAKISGNSTVIGGAWMGFWNCKLKYVFEPKTQKIVFVRETSYKLNVPADVVGSFPIYKTRAIDNSHATVLAPGAKITLITFWPSSPLPQDTPMDNGWYRIKTAKGETGWAKFGAFKDHVEGLPYAG